MAVNGWDEPKEVVSQYVSKAKLKQKILLMGGKVAAEKFGVTSYPTTFLVDSDGTILDRESGFNSASLAKKEKRIRALIAQQEKQR